MISYAAPVAGHVELGLAYAASGSQLFNLKVCAQHAEEEVALGAEVLAEMRRMHGA